MFHTKQGPIGWEDAAKLAEEYDEVLKCEEPGHELYISEHGTLRWVADPIKEQEIMDELGASDLNDLFCNGADKNDPRIRELYKHMGYSLYGFWEVFYWEVNNPLAYQYLNKQGKKRIQITTVVEVNDDIDTDAFVYCFKDLIERQAKVSSNDEKNGIQQNIISVKGG